MDNTTIQTNHLQYLLHKAVTFRSMNEPPRWGHRTALKWECTYLIFSIIDDYEAVQTKDPKQGLVNAQMLALKYYQTDVAQLDDGIQMDYIETICTLCLGLIANQ